MINYLYNVFAALLMVILACFIAIPALRRLMRNVYLTRKGSLTTGTYINPNTVMFSLASKKQMTFITWRRSKKRKNKLEVLYDLNRPNNAEVYSIETLWLKPMDALSWGCALFTMAGALIFSIQYWLAVGLGIACLMVCAFLVRIVLIILVLLALKSRAFHGLRKYVLPDFISQKT